MLGLPFACEYPRIFLGKDNMYGCLIWSKKFPRSLYIISYIVSMYSSIYALYLLMFQYKVIQFLSEARSPLCCVYTDLFNMLFGTILFQNIFNDWLSDIIQIRLQYRALYIYIYKNSFKSLYFELLYTVNSLLCRRCYLSYTFFE